MKSIRLTPSTLIVLISVFFFVLACSKKKELIPEVVPPTTPPKEAPLTLTDFSPKNAMVGTSVMIIGTAFGTDPNKVSVKFGNSVAVNPKEVTETSITLYVPKDAVTGKIELTVNGKTVSSTETFTLTEIPAPVVSITDFMPKKAKTGDLVTITGTAFGTDISFVSVSFGGSPLKNPKTVTPTQITLEVPDLAQTGKIQVSVNGGTAVATKDDFILEATPVVISSFTPKLARVGEPITITGSGFGTNPNIVAVKFGNSAQIKPQSVTGTKMIVAVPSDATTGNIDISVNNGISAKSADNFELDLTPTITSFSPSTVTAGDILIINGSGFGTSLTDIKVYLNTTNNEFTFPVKVTPTQMEVIVPSTAKTGKIRVIYKNTYSIDSQNSFTYLPVLWFNEITPASARVGEMIKINGDFYQADPNSITVYFVGTAIGVKPSSIVDAYIFVRVPDNAQTGEIRITKTGFSQGTSLKDFIVLAPLPEVPTGVWTSRPNFPVSGRAGAVSFVINDKAYIGCGTTNAPFDGFGTNDIWEYDTKYNVWTQKANFGGGARVNAVAFSIGAKGYVGTGLTGSQQATKDLWEYDPTGNTWIQKADFIGTSRYLAVGFSANGKGFIGLGDTKSTELDDFYEYTSSSNSWIKTTSITGKRSSAYAFVVDNKAYIGGGSYQNGGTESPYSDLHMYDPIAKTWTAKLGIPNYLFTNSNASFVIGNNAYVGLGYDPMKSPTAYGNTGVYQYSALSNSWSALPGFAGGARSSSIGFAVNNIGYFGLGETIGATSVYKDLYAYKP